MSGMNSQIHFFIDTASLDKLRIEAEELEISIGELIRRKLANPPIQEEILQLREIKRILNRRI
jgi:hypothetical protein